MNGWFLKKFYSEKNTKVEGDWLLIYRCIFTMGGTEDTQVFVVVLVVVLFWLLLVVSVVVVFLLFCCLCTHVFFPGLLPLPSMMMEEDGCAPQPPTNGIIQR